MIKSIDDTIDFLSMMMRAHHSISPFANDETNQQNLIIDLDRIDKVTSYLNLNGWQGIWFPAISVHTYQTDYLIEAFIKHRILTPDDVLHVCNSMHLDRYAIKPYQLLEGMDKIYKRQISLGGDDSLLNILDI